MLNNHQIAEVKAYLSQGHKQHDIAAHFGVNAGRIAEIATGRVGSAVPTADLTKVNPIKTGRHRVLDSDWVSRLAESLKSVGQINPITIRSYGNNSGYELIAGRHRLEAAIQLGWPSIKAIVLDGIEALDAEEIELRENLDRCELTAAEQAIHFSRLKEIKEEKHKLKAGGKEGNKNAKKEKNDFSQLERNRSNTQSNTAKIVAKETGRSAGAIERDAHRVKSIPQIENVVGTSLDKGVELDALAKMTAAKQEEIISRAAAGEKVSAKTELKKQERAAKEETLAQKQAALPAKRYGVIYADPEWRFETYSENGKDRSADNHYPTSSTEDIMARGVNDIAADDCVLFLWATVPMLPDALQVMESWGFKYKSHAIWAKDKIGTGYWFRNQHELLLVGTRGGVPAPAPGTQWPSWICAPVGKHSEKPVEIYELIEAYYPNLPKIELNARARRHGWDAWGLEAPAEAAE